MYCHISNENICNDETFKAVQVTFQAFTFLSHNFDKGGTRILCLVIVSRLTQFFKMVYHTTIVIILCGADPYHSPTGIIISNSIIEQKVIKFIVIIASTYLHCQTILVMLGRGMVKVNRHPLSFFN